MNEKLLEILHKQQDFEYLKKQNITSKHQLQELRNQTSSSYTSRILKQCLQMNRHTGVYRLSFILSNVLSTVILLISVVLLLHAWLSVPHSSSISVPSAISTDSTETPYTQAQDAIDKGDTAKARNILESTNTPSDTFAGALTYSDLYESEKNYDQAADVIITFITDIIGTHSITGSSLLYTRMLELDNMDLSSDERTKFETCLDACKQSASKFETINALIKEKNYETALELCDAQKADGSSEYMLFELYHTCYMNLMLYETYAFKLIDLAEKVQEVGDYTYQYPDSHRIKHYLEEVYPFVTSDTQKKIDTLNLD